VGDREIHDIRQVRVERYLSALSRTDWATANLRSNIEGALIRQDVVAGWPATIYQVEGEGMFEHTTMTFAILRENNLPTEQPLFLVRLIASHTDPQIKGEYLAQMDGILANLELEVD